MEYHSALKIIELSSFERIWKNLKCLFLSERRQSEIAKLYNSNSITYVEILHLKKLEHHR